MIKIKTSQFTEKLAAAKAQKAAIKEAIPEEVKLVNIDFKTFEVHLENNGGTFTYATGQYLYLYTNAAGKKVKSEILGQ